LLRLPTFIKTFLSRTQVNNVESLFSEQIVIIIFADGLSVTSLQCLGMKRIAVNNNIKSYEI
ncbi:hypothetical protein, partial [Prevotella pectinovora]|uniref:hypothetical protein n=2 Tax=Prevotella pectinovora TaxID=1602169 RepID=UPI003078ED06